MQAKCQIYSTQILSNKQTVCESEGQSQLPVLHCTGTASASGSRPQEKQAEASAIVVAEIKYILNFKCISEQVWFFGVFWFVCFFFNTATQLPRSCYKTVGTRSLITHGILTWVLVGT